MSDNMTKIFTSVPNYHSLSIDFYFELGAVLKFEIHCKSEICHDLEGAIGFASAWMYFKNQQKQSGCPAHRGNG